jgi:hypothetical protein
MSTPAHTAPGRGRYGRRTLARRRAAVRRRRIAAVLGVALLAGLAVVLAWPS